MCGQNLIIGMPKTKAFDVLLRMQAAIAHRGLPAHKGIYVQNNVSMGHQRLPIRGLDHKYDQPYYYKNLIVSFVGELFNAHGECDTPILANSLHNGSFLRSNPFDGFWSVISYNGKVVTIVTDELSKKPLYMRTIPEENVIMVSSEIKALMSYCPEKLTMDPHYFGQVFKWGYSPSRRTPYNEIAKLPAHSVLRIDPKKARIIEGFEWKKNENQLIVSSILYELWRSVCDRLVSDIPLGLLCSGGLDSSIINHHAQSYKNNIKVFHVENGESSYFNLLKIPERNVVRVSLDNVTDEEAQDVMDTPVDLGSVKPQIAMAKAVKKEGIHVLLSGDGADELFGGYTRNLSYDSQYTDIYDELVQYHLPKLDACCMSQTIELRCPFLSRNVLQLALTTERGSRCNKQILKDIYKDVLPARIINRKKLPLKIEEIRKNKEERRYDYTKLFIRRYFNECGRCNFRKYADCNI